MGLPIAGGDFRMFLKMKSGEDSLFSRSLPRRTTVPD